MDQKYWYKRFQKAIAQPYKAIMFDIDGTLVVRGTKELPRKIIPKLTEISEKLPVAFCSGRRIMLPRDFIDQMAKRSKNPQKLRQNWFIVCENGCTSFYYDPQKKDYVQWHEEPWPKKISKDAVRAILTTTLKRYHFQFTEQPSMFTLHMMDRHGLLHPHFTPSYLAKRTRTAAQAIKQEVEKLKGAECVEVVDSGVGVMIVPKNGNKDRGIIEFARFLREKSKMNITTHAKEIAVVGDQPGEGRNDAAFLNGKYGFPFTVDHVDGPQFPVPVFNKKAKRVRGPMGTLALLEQIKLFS